MRPKGPTQLRDSGVERSAAGDGDVEFACYQCEAVFSTRDASIRHQQETHKNGPIFLLPMSIVRRLGTRDTRRIVAEHSDSLTLLKNVDGRTLLMIDDVKIPRRKTPSALVRKKTPARKAVELKNFYEYRRNAEAHTRRLLKVKMGVFQKSVSPFKANPSCRPCGSISPVAAPNASQTITLVKSVKRMTDKCAPAKSSPVKIMVDKCAPAKSSSVKGMADTCAPGKCPLKQHEMIRDDSTLVKEEPVASCGETPPCTHSMGLFCCHCSEYVTSNKNAEHERDCTHSDRLFTCFECGHYFQSLPKRIKRITRKKFSKNDGKRFFCGRCGGCFLSVSTLVDHRKSCVCLQVPVALGTITTVPIVRELDEPSRIGDVDDADIDIKIEPNTDSPAPKTGAMGKSPSVEALRTIKDGVPPTSNVTLSNVSQKSTQPAGVQTESVQVDGHATAVKQPVALNASEETVDLATLTNRVLAGDTGPVKMRILTTSLQQMRQIKLSGNRVGYVVAVKKPNTVASSDTDVKSTTGKVSTENDLTENDLTTKPTENALTKTAKITLKQYSSNVAATNNGVLTPINSSNASYDIQPTTVNDAATIDGNPFLKIESSHRLATTGEIKAVHREPLHERTISAPAEVSLTKTQKPAIEIVKPTKQMTPDDSAISVSNSKRIVSPKKVHQLPRARRMAHLGKDDPPNMIITLTNCPNSSKSPVKKAVTPRASPIKHTMKNVEAISPSARRPKRNSGCADNSVNPEITIKSRRISQRLDANVSSQRPLEKRNLETDIVHSPKVVGSTDNKQKAAKSSQCKSAAKRTLGGSVVISDLSKVSTVTHNNEQVAISSTRSASEANKLSRCVSSTKTLLSKNDKTAFRSVSSVPEIVNSTPLCKRFPAKSLRSRKGPSSVVVKSVASGLRSRSKRCLRRRPQSALPSRRPRRSRGTPKNVSCTPKNVSDTPKNVSDTPKNVSVTPKNVSEMPKNVSETPKNVSGRSKNVSDTPKDVSETPKNVSETPKNVSRRLAELPMDVSPVSTESADETTIAPPSAKLVIPIDPETVSCANCGYLLYSIGDIVLHECACMDVF